MATLKLAIDARGLLTEAKNVTTALGGIKTSAERAFYGVQRAANVVLLPLKMVAAATVSIKTAMVAAGLASVKAASDYELLRHRLRLLIGDKREADRIFSQSNKMEGWFDKKNIVEANIALRSIGIQGAGSLKAVADAAAAMNEDILNVAWAVKMMDAEMFRGLKQFGIDIDTVNIRGLDKFIVRYRDKFGKVQSEIIDDLTETQKKVLGIFEEKYGGSMDYMSNTLPGSIRSMKDALGDLREEFGIGFSKEITVVIQDITKAADNWKTKIHQSGVDFGGELMKARAAILAGMDVGAKIAGQMQDAFKVGRGGEVILAVFTEGAKLIGKGILYAFEASLSLWKLIGRVLGDALMEVLYDSGIPGLKGIGRAKRTQDIAGSLSGLSNDQVDMIARDYGIGKYKSAAFAAGGMSYAPIPKVREEIIASIAEAMAGLSDSDVKKVFGNYSGIFKSRYGYTGDLELDKGYSIGKSLNEAADTFTTRMKDFSNNAITAVQNIETKVARISGGTPFDVAGMFNESYAKYYQEGNSRLGIQSGIQKAVSEIQSVYSMGASKDVNPEIIKAQEEIRKANEDINLQISLLKMTNDERQIAIEKQKIQRIAEVAYAGDIENTNKAVAEFVEQIEKLQKAEKLKRIADGIGDAFGNAFENIVIDAQKASDAILGLLKDIERVLLRQLITQPLAEAISGGITSFPWGGSAEAQAYGNAFYRGNVIPFAGGGIVTGNTYFPMSRGRTGLMGEAGPEAVMPLSRGRDGRLGVKASGGDGVSVAVNVINNTGRQVTAEQSDVQFDGEKYVIGVILKDLNNYGPVRQSMQGVMRP